MRRETFSHSACAYTGGGAREGPAGVRGARAEGTPQGAEKEELPVIGVPRQSGRF